MELTEAMRTQNACRYYSDEPVPDAVFYKAIDSARFGPQGGNRQPVRFLIVRDPEKKKQLAEWYRVPWKAYYDAMKSGEAAIEAKDEEGTKKATWAGLSNVEKALEDANNFADAYQDHPAIVVVCADLSATHPTDTELDRLSIVGGASVYPVTQNFCLALRDQGVATTFTTLLVARREDVGISGAVILSARDFDLALTGIDQSKYYAHAGGGVAQHAPFAMAGYWTVARRRGLSLDQLNGTGQADFFLTYVGCPPLTQIPPADALRINCDIVEFTSEHVPNWVPISMAAYNGADTGLNAYQELGALLASCSAHLDEINSRGTVPVERLAYALGGVSFRVAMDFFEDICKLRAARKMWHDLLTRRYGIEDRRALTLRTHIVTAGSAMTYQEPINNIVRGTVMGMAAVLGGVQSMGVSAYDEALSVPSEQAHRQSLRIQQVLMHETNIPAVVDPLGGSYYVESLTAELEERAWAFFDEIQEHGGFIGALEDGFLHEVASRNAEHFQDEITTGERKIVGVNVGDSDGDPFGIDGFEGSPDAFERGMERLERYRAERETSHTKEKLADLEGICRGDGNVMAGVLEAVEADATIGEIGNVYREVFGSWKFPVNF